VSTFVQATFAQIAAVLREKHRFLIVSHLRPDGDALGCQLALGLSLRAAGKDVTLWNEDGMLDKLAFLPGAELVRRPPAHAEDFEVLVALDTAAYPRLGTPLRAIHRVDLTLNVDHHISNNGYGDLAHIDATAPATGQILYELFASQDMPLTPAIATNLFAAISTDTGSFQYPQTSARTYEIGAALIRAGVDVGVLSRELYESYPLRRIKLLRALLNSLCLSADHRVASFALTLEAAHSLGAIPEDNEGLIDHIRAIETVIVAVFLEELPDGLVRISMRSKDASIADASAICGAFGGGGHRLAAGARVRGTLAEVEARVLAEVEQRMAPGGLALSDGTKQP
jgi:phosphoesterase RecJ-like protein